MSIERVVVNASPLITLFRAGLHPLLPGLFSELCVPEAVWDEVVNGPHDDPATRGLASAEWARRHKTIISPEVLAWNLGAGETSVLSFALANRRCSAILDDRQARRCARILEIPILGTAGVLVLAKRRGLIDSVETGLRRLQMAGLWLSEELIGKLSLEDKPGCEIAS
uniref:Predicted nucleic acid-binding protein, contains PIN domain n=1 Tax=Candidatus Kentrum sp. MB TaxID=2138164 RepID=A0A450XCH1_9GAMM|nr:MAG: Predicted nucleic acid-binding protein, contains PIN domain [Candidatus Kentron sp. MB]VFK31227.1 MAG: Predicted nucleic acid-binding protein, contains PIN domain [Candidatus Kentron sp. MB]VFK75402.1 MAG: Predicted nucleic acid-binding protein, contains PIN domain [Candidatus Kentron sp. MB]